jgi:3-hydroxyisobutyrate dehydrogenase
MRVGFIGLGVMGSAMAGHLAKAGHTLALYDLDLQTAARIAGHHAGAVATRSPGEVGEVSEVVFTMLPNGEAVRDCVCGADGIAKRLQPGSVLVDTSSAEPWLTRETATRLREHGIGMIDAPVSGAQEGAESATLVFMCGGDADDIARVRPLLDLLGRHVFHLGPIGSGHTMKAVNNLATALTCLGTAEAMLIGKAHGLKPSAMIDVLNVSTGMSFVTQKKYGPQVVERRFDDAFKLALMLKDVRIANTLAGQHAIDLPVSALGETLWRAADAELGPGSSVMDIARWYEKTRGITLSD